MFGLGAKKLQADLTSQLYKQNLELAVRNKTLSLLRRLDEIMLSGPDLPGLAKEVAEALVDTFLFPLVGLALAASADDQLEWLHLTCGGEAAELCALDFSDGRGQLVHQKKAQQVLLRVIENKKMAWIAKPAELFPPKVLADLQQKNITLVECCVLPLLLGQGAGGVLVIALPRPHEQLTRDEQEALQNLARAVTIGVQQALLHEQLMDTSEALREANGQLRHMDESKDAFLSMVSHELQTPLSTIGSYAKTLEKALGAQAHRKQYETVKKMIDGIEELLRLVEQLRSVSETSSHQAPVVLRPVEVVRLCQEVVDFLSVKAKEGAVTMTCRKSKMPPVLGDRQKIKQVLMNLLENAMRYAPKGSVTVNFFEELAFVRVEVRDTGLGLTAEDLDKLWQKFFRGSAALTSGQRGSGLGLAICRQLILEMGGEIWAESQGTNKGSTMIFRLKKSTR